MPVLGRMAYRALGDSEGRGAADLVNSNFLEPSPDSSAKELHMQALSSFQILSPKTDSSE